MQYDIKREAAKVSALLSGKINKYEYLTGEEILSSDQKRLTEKVKFANSEKLVKNKQKQLKSKGKANKSNWR